MNIKTLHAVGVVSWAPLGIAIGGIISFLTPFIVKYLVIGAGIYVLSYVGLNILLDTLQNHVVSTMAGLPADMAAIVALSRLDDAITVVMSAVAVKFSFMQLPGAIKRLQAGGMPE